MEYERKLNVRLIYKNEKDLETILKIDSDAFNGNILNRWSLVPYIRYGCVFGLFDCNSLRGFVIFMRVWDDPERAYLVEIAIEKESQGEGYGHYLFSQSLLHLQKSGFSSVTLTVDPDNVRARHIYCDKFGFEIAEYRENEYGNGRDRLYLKLDLENWMPESSNLPS
jgi:ribosomal-protein-alanine N-acetyltransferase